MELTYRGKVRQGGAVALLSPAGEALVAELRALGVDWRVVCLRVALVEKRLVAAGPLQRWAVGQGLGAAFERVAAKPTRWGPFAKWEDDLLVAGHHALRSHAAVAQELGRNLTDVQMRSRLMVRLRKLKSRGDLIEELRREVHETLQLVTGRPPLAAGSWETWSLLWQPGPVPVYPLGALS